MSDLPPVHPMPDEPAPLTVEDFIAFMTGLEEGWYRTADIYPRYLSWTKREGRVAASPKTLGESIQRVLQLRSKKVKGGVSAWLVNDRAVAGRDWFLEPGERQ